MSKPAEIARNEPVGVWAAFQTLLVAVVVLGQEFDWWHWTEGQQNAVLGVYVAVSAIGALFVRASVTPSNRVALTHQQVELIEAGQNQSNGG